LANCPTFSADDGKQSDFTSLRPKLIRFEHRFFIIGSGIALIGSIIGAVAQDVNTLIAAEVLIGIAVAFQQSFVSKLMGKTLPRSETFANTLFVNSSFGSSVRLYQ
jgi:MFS family permease